MICPECSCPINDPEELSKHADTGEEYHWACLQEAYERERIADGEAS